METRRRLDGTLTLTLTPPEVQGLISEVASWPRSSRAHELHDALTLVSASSDAETRPVVLGRRYTDQLTNCTGIAVSRTEYLYGCVRVCLEWGSKDGEARTEWFDEQRLVVGGTAEPVGTTARSGGPRPAPPARDPT